MNNPIQPSDKLLDEAAKRVAYKGLTLLEKELSKVDAAQPASYERIEALSSAVSCACGAMAPPEEAGPQIGD